MPESQGQRENKSVRITLFLRAQMRVLKIVRVVGQRVSYLRLGRCRRHALTLRRGINVIFKNTYLQIKTRGASPAFIIRKNLTIKINTNFALTCSPKIFRF